MRAIVTWWDNLLATDRGRQEELEWTELFDRFSRAARFKGDKVHPGWSPASFEPCARALENVQWVYALCLDYDKGVEIAAAATLWRDHWGFIHTTRKHKPSAPRFRVILPFLRPVSPFEFEAIWIRVNAFAGGKPDPAPKDPSRFWFTPGISDDPECEFVARHLTGMALLDPKAWLRKPAPAPAAASLPSAPARDTRGTTDALRAVEERASAYVAKMPEAIEGSGGDAATWAVAIVLAKGFSLSESTTARMLLNEYNPRCVPPWSEKDLLRKARCAMKAPVEDGFLLKDDRDWQPARYKMPVQPPPDDDWGPESYEDEPAPEAETPAAPDEKTAEQTPKEPASRAYGLLSMVDLMQLVVERLNKQDGRRGAPTGNNELQAAIGGYRHGNVTVFGAKRGFGKTSYGNMVTRLSVPDLNVLSFAGEDAAEMYGKRFLAELANLNAMLLRDFRCNRSDWPNITRALEKAPRNPFFVRAAGRPVEWIAKAIREVAAELAAQGKQLDLVVIDYLQKFKAAARLQDRRNEVTYVTQTLSDATKVSGASGLFFSQLKRTEREEPELEDLKESGDIEDMADHVVLGWKKEGSAAIKAQRMIKIAKNKDGTEASELATIELEWNPRTANFIAQKPEPDEWSGIADNDPPHWTENN